MGRSKSNNLNAITKHIWEFCVHQQIWLSAAHLPDCKNTDADLASRHFNDRTEWMLDRRIFEQAATKFGYHTIDLFASHLNSHCPSYASWRPDPGAQYVNAFSVCMYAKITSGHQGAIECMANVNEGEFCRI